MPDQDHFVKKYGPWALVTGASSEIGEHIAQELAAKGVSIVLAARRIDRLQNLATKIQNEHEVDARAVARRKARDRVAWWKAPYRARGYQPVSLFVRKISSTTANEHIRVWASVWRGAPEEIESRNGNRPRGRRSVATTFRRPASTPTDVSR